MESGNFLWSMSIKYKLFLPDLFICFGQYSVIKINKGNQLPHGYSWPRSITYKLAPGPFNTSCIAQCTCYGSMLFNLINVPFIAFVHHVHGGHTCIIGFS